MRLKLNISPCPNDTFMFEALINGRIDTRGYTFDVAFADIEELNARVTGGGATGGDTASRPDVSKISYAVLPAITEKYALLDSGSALGHGNGPVLVARRGFGRASDFIISSDFRVCLNFATEGVCDSGRGIFSPGDGGVGVPTATEPGKKSTGSETKKPKVVNSKQTLSVAIPGAHTTAGMLLKRLFPQLTDLRPMLFSDIAPAVASGAVDAGVLIHEGRFTYRDHGLELVADLGVRWDRATGGLPLPLGAIVASRTLSAEVVRDMEEMIRESIEYGFANPGASREFIKTHAQEMDDKVINSHIRLFVNDNSLTLSPRARLAISTLTGVEGLF